MGSSVQLRAMGTPQQEHQLRVWDFVLVRADGSKMWVHPQWNVPDVEVHRGPRLMGGEDPVPRSGLGQSDSKGTYVRMTRAPRARCPPLAFRHEKRSGTPAREEAKVSQRWEKRRSGGAAIEPNRVQ